MALPPKRRPHPLFLFPRGSGLGSPFKGGQTAPLSHPGIVPLPPVSLGWGAQMCVSSYSRKNREATWGSGAPPPPKIPTTPGSRWSPFNLLARCPTWFVPNHKSASGHDALLEGWHGPPAPHLSPACWPLQKLGSSFLPSLWQRLRGLRWEQSQASITLDCDVPGPLLRAPSSYLLTHPCSRLRAPHASSCQLCPARLGPHSLVP